LVLWHQLNKSALNFIQQRDFLEKKLIFRDKDVTYIYFSSIPDEIQPPQDKVSRAYTLIGFHVFERLPDGRILYTALNQNDFNLKGALGKMGAAMAVNQIPKTLKVWFERLNKYLKEHEKDEDEVKPVVIV